MREEETLIVSSQSTAQLPSSHSVSQTVRTTTKTDRNQNRKQQPKNDDDSDPSKTPSSHTLYVPYATTTCLLPLAAIPFVRATIGSHLLLPSTSLWFRHNDACACLSWAECTSLLDRTFNPFLWLAIHSGNPPNDSTEGQQQR